MKRILAALMTLLVLQAASCKKDPSGGNGDNTPAPKAEKLADVTYQLNVYSFADSDGNGWGDINGVTEHLDYLEEMGISAIWLSPIQQAGSYHGYDILDYNTIDPRLGTEDDFRNLIDKAAEKDIDIYMDYVLNHSGKGPWFKNAIESPDSPYRNYYVFSSNPAQDIANGRIDNFAGATAPGMGAWHALSSLSGRLHFKLDWSKKTVTVTETTEAAQSSNPSASKWLYYGDGTTMGLYTTGTDIFEITVDFASTWGFLIRTSTSSWDAGTKWGGSGQALTLGTPYTINSNPAQDIVFSGGNYYFASFDGSMPDLNYGPAASAATSGAFKDLAASADKWINMGVKGMRLDAVVWIYQKQTAANVTFLQQWYDRINTSYKARGGEGDFYMVAEAWEDSVEAMAPYYQAMPSNFNFYYWWTLKDRINKGKGNDFAKTVIYFRNLFAAQRPGFIDAIKLTNHDEDRAANDLDRNGDKIKLAAAVLLTSPGKPFIYQGEELGYWGNKSHGDEYIRTPIKWTRTGAVPMGALSGKVDHAMLSADISVEAQKATPSSVWNVYKKFLKARNSNMALAHGEITEVPTANNAAAVWTLSYKGESVYVAHNFGSGVMSLTLPDNSYKNIVVSNGVASVNGTSVTLGACSSIVLAQ